MSFLMFAFYSFGSVLKNRSHAVGGAGGSEQSSFSFGSYANAWRAEQERGHSNSRPLMVSRSHRNSPVISEATGRVCEAELRGRACPSTGEWRVRGSLGAEKGNSPECGKPHETFLGYRCLCRWRQPSFSGNLVVVDRA